MTYTGNTLIDLGFEPGPHFELMLKVGNSMGDHDCDPARILEVLQEIYDDANFVPETIPLKESGTYDLFMDEGRNEFELTNTAAVAKTMDVLVKTPTIVNAAVMPDACPAGSEGTIPVGGVVSALNAIHPGMHSADICCSMYLTTVNVDRNVSDVLDAVQKRSHFGPGGRPDLQGVVLSDILEDVLDRAKNNTFMNNVPMRKAMTEHMGTQGDGNHFFYVGKRESTGKLTFVTHHGSRKPGALLYKAGMKVADSFRLKLSPDTLKQNAWIPSDTPEGEQYWEALQIIREWTKINHNVIHTMVMDELGISDDDVSDRFWNEHNFVFRDKDVFHHAKGSTPVKNTADDADQWGRTIIPLNMGEPILLVTNHINNYWGFAPHGAGRNMSRTQFSKLNAGKTNEEIIQEQAGHIDARFYTGTPDRSELPGAYKDAAEIQRQIESYGLANIVDRVLPLGSMMAGESYQPWRK